MAHSPHVHSTKSTLIPIFKTRRQRSTSPIIQIYSSIIMWTSKPGLWIMRPSSLYTLFHFWCRTTKGTTLGVIHMKKLRHYRFQHLQFLHYLESHALTNSRHTLSLKQTSHNIPTIWGPCHEATKHFACLQN